MIKVLFWYTYFRYYSVKLTIRKPYQHYNGLGLGHSKFVFNQRYLKRQTQMNYSDLIGSKWDAHDRCKCWTCIINYL